MSTDEEEKKQESPVIEEAPKLPPKRRRPKPKAPGKKMLKIAITLQT